MSMNYFNLSEDDKKMLQDLYEESNCKIFSHGDEHEYSINFKVTNPAVAQAFLVDMLNNRGPDVGIEVTSINFEPYKSRNQVKEQLIHMIQEMDL